MTQDSEQQVVEAGETVHLTQYVPLTEEQIVERLSRLTLALVCNNDQIGGFGLQVSTRALDEKNERVAFTVELTGTPQNITAPNITYAFERLICRLRNVFPFSV